jgi:anti-anti-sigma factor
MSKVYLLSCRDVGVECDFEARGTSLEDVMQRAAEHGAAAHNMKGFGPELYLKMHRGVRTVEDSTPVGSAAGTPSGPSVQAPLDVTIEPAGQVQVVRAIGRLDSATADTFDARMQQAIVAPGIRVALDLGGINYVSSAGLRSLLVLLKQVRALGGALVLAAVHPRVQDIFDIAGFTSMFAIVPTPADALLRLQREQ